MIFAVLRPALRTLVTPRVPLAADREGEAYAGNGTSPDGSGVPALPGAAPGTQMTLAQMKDAIGPALPQPSTFEARMDNARQAVKEDPRLVAQVVKEWIATDG